MMRLDSETTNPDSLAPGSAPAGTGASVSFRRDSLTRQAFSIVFIATLALACYYIISHYLVQNVTVVGVSMLPTLHDSDHYLLNRWVYYFREPHQADVVVLRDPVDQGFSVKRVIAGAGDTVYLKNGEVYVNGRKLRESYLKPGTLTFLPGNRTEQCFRCEDNQYFVLGDNRNNSVDSRAYGPVPRQNIQGLIVR